MGTSGLNAADYLKLGVVRIWGVGTEITEVTITLNDGPQPLTPQHNLESQVSTFLEHLIQLWLMPMSKYCVYLH